MYKYLPIILLLFSAQSQAETNWYRVAANTVVVSDWLQTREIARNNAFYETNNFLGKYPSQSEVNRYFLTVLFSYNILGELLPEPYGEFVYFYATLEHGKAVIENYSIGVRINF